MTRPRKRYGILGAAALIVGAVLVALGPAAVGQALRIGTAAPEIAGAPWHNSGPLTTAGLRGRVVFVEFWTYG